MNEKFPYQLHITPFLLKLVRIQLCGELQLRLRKFYFKAIGNSHSHFVILYYIYYYFIFQTYKKERKQINYSWSQQSKRMIK